MKWKSLIEFYFKLISIQHINFLTKVKYSSVSAGIALHKFNKLFMHCIFSLCSKFGVDIISYNATAAPTANATRLEACNTFCLRCCGSYCNRPFTLAPLIYASRLKNELWHFRQAKWPRPAHHFVVACGLCVCVARAARNAQPSFAYGKNAACVSLWSGSLTPTLPL